MIKQRQTAALAVWLACGLAACNDTPPEQVAPDSGDAATSAGADASPVAPGRHEWITADGNRMPYIVAGEGGATALLVHCWMCDRTFWSEQVPVLAEHYRTIALNLPGHGGATEAREKWTVSGFGDDVAGFVQGLDLTNVVLVGHSMGGPVSLRAAALAGDRVRGIVAVDTLHDAEFEFSGEEVEHFMSAFEADFVGSCENFVRQMIPEEDAAETVNQVLKTSCREERSEIGVELMKDFTRIDLPRWFADAGVPIRAINASGPNPTRIDSNRRYADFDAVFLDDVGHYLQMTRPAQFNPLLLAAIAEILRGDDA